MLPKRSGNLPTRIGSCSCSTYVQSSVKKEMGSKDHNWYGISGKKTMPSWKPIHPEISLLVQQLVVKKSADTKVMSILIQHLIFSMLQSQRWCPHTTKVSLVSLIGQVIDWSRFNRTNRTTCANSTNKRIDHGDDSNTFSLTAIF